MTIGLSSRHRRDGGRDGRPDGVRLRSTITIVLVPSYDGAIGGRYDTIDDTIGTSYHLNSEISMEFEGSEVEMVNFLGI